ncbi:YKL121W [Saccharomyces arboricola H-6]|uniref:YKL121W n=1 Tax=Saccharomyces arboricola (strain H-6 / AS 2.3317 / CBS 10644) TaxID=1160507 RepID=J8PLF5_SACAR|nr:YKL121W [Saccharomyces arboricola H-6]
MFKSKTSAANYNETLNSKKGDHHTAPINPKEMSQIRHLNIPGNQNRHPSIVDSGRSSINFNGGYSADITPAQLSFIDNVDYSTRIRKTLQRNSVVTNGYSNLSENDRWYFDLFDREYFENYLEEPAYIKIFKKKEDLGQFDRMFLAQELKLPDAYKSPTYQSEPAGNNPELFKNSICCSTFSHDGKYMVIGCKDGSLHLWKVINSPVKRSEMGRSEKSASVNRANSLKIQRHLASISSHNGSLSSNDLKPNSQFDGTSKQLQLYAPVFYSDVFRVFLEHALDILDANWSKNGFLITASMDKTAKLWHPDKKYSLKTFAHPDFVTSAIFFPNDDRFIITGCLDHKCRLWSILDNEVSYAFDCKDLITSLTLSPSDGEYTVIGTFNGYIYVLLTHGLKFISSFHVVDKSTQGSTQNNFYPSSEYGKTQHGPRITGLQCFFSKVNKNLRLIVTTNDSKIQIFDLNEKRPLEVLKGFQSGSSWHRGQFQMMKNEPVVFTGSDNHWFYAWRMQSYNLSAETNSVVPPKKKRLSGNMSFKGLLRIVSNKSTNDEALAENPNQDGSRTFLNTPKNVPQAQSVGGQAIKNNHYVSFHAHSSPVTCANIAPGVALKNLSLSNDLIFELTLQHFKELHQQSVDYNDTDNNKATKSFKETGGFSSNLSNVVNNVGTILITTDNQGLLRVFRTDILPEIREKVIEKFHQYNSFHLEAAGKRDSHNSDSILESRVGDSRLAEGYEFNSIPLSNTPNSRSSHDFYELHSSSGQVGSSVPPRPSAIFKNTIFNKSNGSFISLKSRSESTNSTIFGPHDIPKSSTTSPKLQCDVCNGSKFESVSKNLISGGDSGFTCTDCGTILNDFR